MNQRFRYFLRALLPVACILFIQNAIAIFGMQILLVVDSLRYKGQDYLGFIKTIVTDATSPSFVQAASLGASIVGILVFGLWYLRLKAAMVLRENKGSEVITIRFTLSYRLGFFMAIFAFAAQYVGCYLTVFLGMAFPDWADAMAKMQEAQGLGAGEGVPAIMLINAILFAPICEELCFRGITYNYAALSIPARSANVVQAILFAGLHGNPIQGIYTFIMGMAFGKIYMKTGRLSVPIILHILFNASGLLLKKYIFIGSTPVTFYITLITSLMCFYYSFIWILEEVDKDEKSIKGNH